MAYVEPFIPISQAPHLNWLAEKGLCIRDLFHGGGAVRSLGRFAAGCFAVSSLVKPDRSAQTVSGLLRFLRCLLVRQAKSP